MPTMYEFFRPRIQTGKEIGIEIEMEGRNLLTDLEKFWIVHGDNSLRGDRPAAASEYVLKEPVPRAKTLQRLTYLQTELAKSNSTLRPSDRCGVHVHVNCQDLDFKKVMNFATLYLIFEELLVKWCGEQREGNLFCLRASDADYIIQGMCECMASGDMSPVQSNHYRYAAMNLGALRKFGSVEFRAMGTPKKFSKIERWIKLLLKVKDASQGYQEPYNIIEDMSAQGGQLYVRNVFQELSKHLVHDNVNKMCMDGVRRVQQVVYTPLQTKKKKKGTPIRDVGMEMPEWVNERPARPLYQGNVGAPRVAQGGQVILDAGDIRWQHMPDRAEAPARRDRIIADAGDMIREAQAVDIEREGG